MTPYFDDPWLTVYAGDCRAVLETLPSESVHCVVTSPPYFGLRDYGDDGQIGLEATPEQYVESMVAVFREVRRVLRNDGTLWLNLGDSYAGGAGGRGDAGRNFHEPGMGGGASTKHDGQRLKRDLAATGLKPKDLVGVPWRVAFALQADGWYLRSEITWCKPNAMPESVTDRPTSATEKLFLFTKSPTYFFDQEAVRERVQPDRPSPGSRGATGMEDALSGFGEGTGNAPALFGDTGRTGESQSSGASVLLHREGQGRDEAVYPEREGEGQPGPWRPQATGAHGYREHLDGSGMGRDQGGAASALSLLRTQGAAYDGPSDPTLEGWSAYGGERPGGVSELQQREGQSVGRNLRNWWVIPSAPYKGAHFATFPPKLVEPCIKAGCPELGTVLDPFAGSGTTLMVAQQLSRRAIGIDLNADYLVQCLRRNAQTPLGLAG